MNSFKRARTTERSYDKLSPKDKKKYNLYKQGVAIDREEKAIARDEGRARKSFLGFGDVLNRRGKKIEQQELRARDNYDAASLGMERAIKAEEKFLETAEHRAIRNVRDSTIRIRRARMAKLANTQQGLRESFQQFGQQQEPDFSVEQESMASMFGQGDKIWGTQGEPVRMNHDLNPRRRGETGTGEMFGF